MHCMVPLAVLHRCNATIETRQNPCEGTTKTQTLAVRSVMCVDLGWLHAWVAWKRFSFALVSYVVCERRCYYNHYYIHREEDMFYGMEGWLTPF